MPVLARLAGLQRRSSSRSPSIAFRLDGESLRPLWALPLQQFVYRQLMYLVIIEATISALVGLRAHWKTIPRTGDVRGAARVSPRLDLSQTTRPWRMVFSVTTRGSTNCSR